MANTEKKWEEEEKYYLGKKISELNIYEQRYRKLMQLMRLDRLLKSAKITHKQLPDRGST